MITVRTYSPGFTGNFSIINLPFSPPEPAVVKFLHLLQKRKPLKKAFATVLTIMLQDGGIELWEQHNLSVKRTT